MKTPILGNLTKGVLSALSFALVLGLQPAGAALAQSHDHGGGGHGGGHGGGGHMSGGHAGGGYAGGGHMGGGHTAYAHGGYGMHGYGRGYDRGHGGTRYLWGGLPFYFSGGYYYGDCSWLRERAHETGSPYWYHRYHLCRAY